jgi:NADPH:quinone reductase-like Zn-dependent oxidoreductase
VEEGLPEASRAVHIRTVGSNGGPEALELIAELPLPWERLGPRDVMLRVRAAGVNEHDVQQRRGLCAHPPGHSPLPGLEVAGRVVALGSKAGDLCELGDEVCAVVPGGGYADYVVAREANCLSIPPWLSISEAACLPLALSTWNEALHAALETHTSHTMWNQQGIEPCRFRVEQLSVPLVLAPAAAAAALRDSGTSEQQLRVAVDAAFALEDADHAHRLMDSGSADGRVVLLLDALPAV